MNTVISASGRNDGFWANERTFSLRLDGVFLPAVSNANAAECLLVFGFFRLRCPNCGDAPANSASFADRSYSRGINPLPKRCMTCGCFLSRKALQGALDGR